VDADEELLRRLCAGDEQAFGGLVDRYHGRIVRLAQTIVGRHELAEEVAQETWIAVLRGASRFEGRSSVRSWLFAICVNRARSTSGREFRTPSVDATSPSVDPSRFTSSGQWVTPPEDWSAVVDDRLLAAKLAAEAQVAIADLPEVQRQVVTLRDVEGLSSTEVCHVLSLSAANERVLLHRGRSRIRAALEQACGGELT
jgi:RNA polymerase sigma-70 factor, ECF subfamily